MDYKELNEEQKAKARECKTPEEIMALAASEGYELSDEELNALGVAGGWCVTDQKGCPDRCGCLCPRV
ncbi:MAG: Nif11-like leader peptide family natural product precursor [Atopobiaceae bacterium]|nr:Nif11-like leader peptide family natural product precursor [Atopobiaceae bacterium]